MLFYLILLLYFIVYLLLHFHCNLGYVFLSFDWIKTIIIIIIIIIIIKAINTAVNGYAALKAVRVNVYVTIYFFRTVKLMFLSWNWEKVYSK